MVPLEENENSKAPDMEEGTRMYSEQTTKKSPEVSKLEGIEESENKEKPFSSTPVQDCEETVAAASEQQCLAMNPYHGNFSSNYCNSGRGKSDSDDGDDKEKGGDKVHEHADRTKKGDGEGDDFSYNCDDNDDEELSRILFNELVPQRRGPPASSDVWRSPEEDPRQDTPNFQHPINERSSFIRRDGSPEYSRHYDPRFDCRDIGGTSHRPGKTGRCLDPLCRCELVDVYDHRLIHPLRVHREEPNLFYADEETEPDSDPDLCGVGAGLANMGNTCFLNAVLQCFTHTVPVIEGLRPFNQAQAKAGQDDCEAFCVLNALRSHIKRSLEFAGRVIRPYEMVDNLCHISSFFQRNQQEDAHEFLQCLLDKIGNCWSKHDAQIMYSENRGLVQQVFGGSLISQLRCCKCSHISNTREPIIDMSLEIEDVDSLDNALQSFTRVEKIEEDVKVTCESCKEQVPVEKQLKLEQLPNIAVLHLKRFKSDGGKIDEVVKYPSELNLRPYATGLADENSESMYELYGVVVHIGASFAGHYYSYIKSAPDAWYLFDDRKVRKVEEQSVLSQEAYILFYKRKGIPWFSSLMENSKSCLEKDISNTSPKSVLDNVGPICIKNEGEDLFGCKAVESKEDSGEDLVHCFSGSRHDTTVRDTTMCQAQDLPRANQSCDVGDIKADKSDPPASTGLKKHSRWLSRMKEKNNENNVEAQNPIEVDPLCLIKTPDERFDAPGTTEAVGRPFVDGRICDQEMKEASSSPEVLPESVTKDKDKDAGMNPSTPPRSPSPDIYAEEPEDVSFHSIQRNNLKAKREITPPSRKFANKAKAVSDLKKKEAAKYVQKMMPSGRSKHFMAAICDASSNKKKRIGSCLSAGHSPSKSRKTTSPTRTIMRPVAAGVGR